jgi:D-glycero-alpha-D-manno-heptose-7-phosphate kinase
VLVHSSAPTRLDLAGGTLDIWPLYLFHEGAQTLNAAITVRAESTLSASEDGRWRLQSQDTGETLTVSDLEACPDAPRHRLVLRLLQHFQPDPITVVTRSDSPVGAGLAGSSALNIALCGALSQYVGTASTAESLMSLAANLEAQVIGVPTGVQDYRPAMFGGIAAVEMGPAGVTRSALGVDPEALGARIVLTYTGQSRDSGINNWEVTKRHIDGDRSVIDLFDEIADVAIAMRGALETSRWDEVGRQLAREWTLRKQLAPGVTTPTIDALVDHGLNAGAWGAKVCGAGGGGCLLFLADPSNVPAVRRTLSNAGASVIDAKIDSNGLQVHVR